jgi:YggT family protein
MLKDALHFLITTVFNLFTFLLLLRFYMQWLKAPFQNPLAQMCMALTDFIVKPARKWIPSWKQLDISTLLLALIVQCLLYLLLMAIAGFSNLLLGAGAWLTLLMQAAFGVVKLSIDLFFYAILLQAILSWVNPQTPISGVLNALTRPILAPIRRWVSPINGFDFSGIIALILLQMVNISIVPHLERYLNSIF